MKFSVLINNFNYGAYLLECVQSALNQRYPAHEVIVVDDGSTDDSLQILASHFAGNPRVKIVSQCNLGQTAAIAKGIEAACGDIVCLLDADDRYKPEYLETLEQHYQDHPEVDLTFCRYEAFGERAFGDNEFIWLNPQKDYDYGYTALLTYFGNVHWIGNLTSTISLRIRMARALRLDEVAREFHAASQGDYSVLLRASLLGARKYYLHRALTDYRLHKVNHYLLSRSTPAGQYMVWFNDRTRAQYFKSRSNISEEMYPDLEREAKVIPDPDPKHLEAYRNIPKPGSARQKPVSWLRTCERKLRRLRKRLFHG